MMPGCLLARWPSIQAATRSSHGNRSASASGMPACILAMFDSGWSESPSSNGQPSRAESSSAIVDLPDPDTPMITRIGGLPPMRACAVEAVEAGFRAPENPIGAADEKPAFQHTDNPPDAVLQSCRIGHAAEITIKNAVAAISDKGRGGRHACASAGTKHFE